MRRLPSLGALALAVMLLAGFAACGPSDEEVDARIATAIAGIPNGTTMPPTATPVTFPTPLPTATPVALPTPLPTATPLSCPQTTK